MANARNSLPSAAERVRQERRMQEQGVAGRKGAPFPAPVRPLPLLRYALSQGSTQRQLKLTAIYCISIMVSHLPLRGGPASRAPFRASYCIAAYPPVSSSLHVRVQHESSGCTVDLLRALWYTSCESTQKYPTANYPPRVYHGNCIIPRKLSRATRVHARMHARVTQRFLCFPESSLVRRKARGRYFCRRERREKRSPREFHFVPSYTLIAKP